VVAETLAELSKPPKRGLTKGKGIVYRWKRQRWWRKEGPEWVLTPVAKKNQEKNEGMVQ